MQTQRRDRARLYRCRALVDAIHRDRDDRGHIDYRAACGIVHWWLVKELQIERQRQAIDRKRARRE
jgi:hypothetical protein